MLLTSEQIQEIWRELQIKWSGELTPIACDKYTLLLVIGQYAQSYAGVIPEAGINPQGLTETQILDIKNSIQLLATNGNG